MRKIEKKDVIMFDNLLTLLNRRSIFRELNAEECSGIHQARMWAIAFRQELEADSLVSEAISSAKCVDPGPQKKVKGSK